MAVSHTVKTAGKKLFRLTSPSLLQARRQISALSLPQTHNPKMAVFKTAGKNLFQLTSPSLLQAHRRISLSSSLSSVPQTHNPKMTLFLTVGKNPFRLTSPSLLQARRQISIPCPYPHPFNKECLKIATKLETTLSNDVPSLSMEKIMTSQTHVTPDYTIFTMVASYAQPWITELSPCLTFLALHHFAFFCFLIYKDPSYFKDETMKLVGKVGYRYWITRRSAKIYLAGMSKENFERFCAISKFIFSPARTMAAYKDLLLAEIRILRNDGVDESTYGSVSLLRFGEVTYQWSGNSMMQLILHPCRSGPGEKFYLVVYGDSLILVDEMVTPTIIGITKLHAVRAFRPRDVSATLANQVLTVNFPVSSSEEQNKAECCLVRIDCC